MSRTIRVLDHGYVTLRNISGPTRRHPLRKSKDSDAVFEHTGDFFDADDTDPANAARMSFDGMDKGRTRELDIKLSAYLMKNKHTSPFEMIQIWFEMKMPIFVARQFVRHRTARINEESGRYVTLSPEWYIPSEVGGKAKNAKQGQEDNLSIGAQARFIADLDSQCFASYQLYLKHLDAGVAPEEARMFLHLNHYTKWLWNIDAHNFMHFLSLRDHSHAQKQAQAYARALDKLVREVLPETMRLYDQFRRLPEPPTWHQCEALSNMPEVDEAMRALMANSIADNATGLIKVILEQAAKGMPR